MFGNSGLGAVLHFVEAIVGFSVVCRLPENSGPSVGYSMPEWHLNQFDSFLWKKLI